MSIQKFVKAELEVNGVVAGPEGQGQAFTDFDSEHHSMVCAGCSCLCDDVSYYQKQGRVVRTLNLCEVGMKRLCSGAAADRLSPLSPGVLQEAVTRCGEIFTTHRPVLVLGADSIDEAGVMASLQLAQALRALWLPWPFEGMRRFYGHVARVGWSTALLDEVRDQADLVMFWHADPLVTHHRHLSRYSFFPRGRFTERGSSDRTLVAITRGTAVMEPLCQQFFALAPDEDANLIRALAHPAQGPVPAHRDLPLLIKALQRASYIAAFVDADAMRDEAICALFEWATAVNREGRQRYVILPLWSGGANTAGFTQCSLEGPGTGWGYDFSGGPAGGDLEADWEVVAEKVKSVLMFESGPEGANRARLPGPLTGKPLAVISPFKQVPLESAQVVIPTALSGIEGEGIFYRADGLPFKVEPLGGGMVATGYPPVVAVLSDMLKEVSP